MKRKRAKPHTFIADGNNLTAEKGQACAKQRKKDDPARSENRKMELKKCASSKCRLCSSYEHTAHTCSELMTSN